MKILAVYPINLPNAFLGTAIIVQEINGEVYTKLYAGDFRYSLEDSPAEQVALGYLLTFEGGSEILDELEDKESKLKLRMRGQ